MTNSPSRRRALATLAAIPVAGIPAIAVTAEPDPVFEAIEQHKRAAQAEFAAHDEYGRLGTIFHRQHEAEFEAFRAYQNCPRPDTERVTKTETDDTLTIVVHKSKAPPNDPPPVARPDFDNTAEAIAASERITAAAATLDRA